MFQLKSALSAGRTGNQYKTEFFRLIHGLFTSRTLDQKKLVQESKELGKVPSRRYFCHICKCQLIATLNVLSASKYFFGKLLTY